VVLKRAPPLPAPGNDAADTDQRLGSNPEE